MLSSLPPQKSFIILLMLLPQLIVHSHPAFGLEQPSISEMGTQTPHSALLVAVGNLRKFPPTPLSFLPTIWKLRQMPHLAGPTLCRQNALGKKHHFPFQLSFTVFPPKELLLSPLLPPPFTSALLFHQQLDKTAPACSCAIALSISFHHFHTSSCLP